jgi:CubicO group peptidase (beta-lactamase class C family)
MGRLTSSAPIRLARLLAGAGSERPLAPRNRWVALAQILGLACGLGVFGFLLASTVGPYFQAGPPAGAPEAVFKAELDESAPRIIRHFHVPGVVISTVVDGAPSKAYAYGYADLATRRPMTVDTVFRAASISKSLTAWGVLRLAQTGKVGLDRPVARYLDRWPLASSAFPTDGVTVRRLLNHTAGVDGGEDTFHAPGQPAPSAQDVLARQGPAPGGRPGPATLVAPAGKRFIYSVPGYTLLQLMIERQTGQSFADFMRRTVLGPISMRSSSFAWDAAVRDRMARPYRSDEQPIPLEVPDDQAADSLFTTAPDLARFVAAPMPDKALPAGAGVLSAATVHDAYLDLSQVPNLGLSSAGPEAPGPGYFVEAAPNRRTILTNVGFDPGWSSLFVMSPTTGDGLVVLTNSDGGAPAIAQITSIWSSWRGLPPSNLILGYRTLGLTAALFLSLLAALDVAYAGGLAAEAIGGRRRIGFAVGPSFSGAIVELGLAASVLALWAGVFAAVRTMPTMNAVGGAAISVLVIVVLSRAALPMREPALASVAA